jgi:hypothetical protein
MYSLLYDLSPFELYFENMAIYIFSIFSLFFIMLEKSFSLACVFIFFFFLAHVSFEGKLGREIHKLTGVNCGWMLLISNVEV